MHKFYDRGLVSDVACESGQDFFLCAKSLASQGIIGVQDFRCAKREDKTLQRRVFGTDPNDFTKQNLKLLTHLIGALPKLDGSVIRKQKEDLTNIARSRGTNDLLGLKIMRRLATINETTALKLYASGRARREVDLMCAFSASASQRFVQERRSREASQISFSFSQ